MSEVLLCCVQGNLSWCPFTHFRSGGDLSQGWNDIANKLQQVRPYTRELRQPVSRPGVSTATAYPSHLTTRLSDADRCCQQTSARPARRSSIDSSLPPAQNG